MKKILFLTIITMSFILFGCNQQEPVEENKEPEVPVIDWGDSQEPNQSTIVEDKVLIAIKREFMDKVFAAEDFPILEIEDIEYITSSLYSKYLEEGKIPETYYPLYTIILKNKGEQYVYEAIDLIKDLEFIYLVEPSFYIPFC